MRRRRDDDAGGVLRHPRVQRELDRSVRTLEGRHRAHRRELRSYSGMLADEREILLDRREQTLHDSSLSQTDRHARLTTIDSLWSQHLARALELRDTLRFGEKTQGLGRPALAEYMHESTRLFRALLDRIEELSDEAVPRAVGRTDLASDASSKVGLGMAEHSTPGGALWTQRIDDDSSREGRPTLRRWKRSRSTTGS
jgi:preprotein translocase subunit SecA